MHRSVVCSTKSPRVVKGGRYSYTENLGKQMLNPMDLNTAIMAS